jgi:hypothetical protein
MPLDKDQLSPTTGVALSVRQTVIQKGPLAFDLHSRFQHDGVTKEAGADRRNHRYLIVHSIRVHLFWIVTFQFS